jgi:hypothetical protein
MFRDQAMHIREPQKTIFIAPSFQVGYYILEITGI